MERSNLICCLVGFFTAKHPSISSDDLKIEIDNRLIESQMTPLGTEPNDSNLLQDLLDETIFSVMGRGINRSQRRSVMNK
mgnify:CR=1 FL=1